MLAEAWLTEAGVLRTIFFTEISKDAAQCSSGAKNDGLCNPDTNTSLKMHAQKSNGIEETGLCCPRVKVTIIFPFSHRYNFLLSFFLHMVLYIYNILQNVFPFNPVINIIYRSFFSSLFFSSFFS